jgi:tetratricopeptide (TPR) repeat protein
MASTNKTPAPLLPRVNDDESIGEWIALHKTAVAWGALALLVLLGGGWFYQRSQSLKEERAEKAYYLAREEAAAGNNQLAKADLKKMADRYSGTRAGTQGRIYLAQIYFTDRNFKGALDELAKAEGTASSDFSGSIHLLEANAYEELKDFVKAAEQYQRAADAARFPNDKLQAKAYQARALMAGGKRAEALAIWEELAKDETTPFAVEAKLRIGELEASPAKV